MLDRRKCFLGSTFIFIDTAAQARIFGERGSADVRVTRKIQGSLPAFGLGFSMGKNIAGHPDFFTRSNTTFVACCRRLGLNVTRVGVNHVDKVRWAPLGAGGNPTTNLPSSA